MLIALFWRWFLLHHGAFLLYSYSSWILTNRPSQDLHQLSNLIILKSTFFSNQSFLLSLTSFAFFPVFLVLVQQWHHFLHDMTKIGKTHFEEEQHCFWYPWLWICCYMTYPQLISYVRFSLIATRPQCCWWH